MRILINYVTFLRFVSSMINLDDSSKDCGTTEIINRQAGTSLVLVFQEGETLAFASVLITYEVDMHWLTELGEDGDDIAFTEFIGKPTDVDVCGIGPVSVP